MSIDPIAVAATNATVLTIFQVVLGWQLSRASSPLSEMLQAAAHWARALNETKMGHLASGLQGKAWMEFKTDPAKGTWGFHKKRLDELVKVWTRADPTTADGEMFVNTVLSIAVQYPFPTEICPGPNKTIWFQKKAQLLNLGSRRKIERWLRAIDGLRHLPINDRSQRRVSKLIDAANRGGPDRREDFRQILKHIRMIPDIAEELKPRVEEWQARRPTTLERTLLIGGFVGGALMFAVGVLLPLIMRDQAPYWAYAYIPAGFYAIVLLVLTAYWARRIADL
jgi:hypothetical protein